jgi:hypothetical protein
MLLLDVPKAKIAQTFGVSWTAIHNIANGNNWSAYLAHEHSKFFAGRDIEASINAAIAGAMPANREAA